MFEFEPGHRVLIVGGAGDIGSAMAQAFLDQGCEVIATGVDQAAVDGCRLPASHCVCAWRPTPSTRPTLPAARSAAANDPPMSPTPTTASTSTRACPVASAAAFICPRAPR